MVRRVLLWSSAVVTVLVAAAVAALFLVDLSRYRPLVEDRVGAALGSPVTIAGDLEIGASLTPTLAASEVSVANAPGGSRPEMARIGRLEIGVELLPLLAGDVRITHLVVVEADILLETVEDGVGNWAYVSGAGPVEPEAPSEPGSGAAVSFIGRVELRRSTVAHVGPDGVSNRLDIDRAVLSSAAEDDPVAIEIDCVIDGLPVRIVAETGSLAAMLAGAADWPVRVTVTSGDNRISATGSVADPKTFAGYRLQIDAALHDAEPIAALLGWPVVELPDVTVLATIAGGPDEIAVSGLSVGLGDSALGGELTLSLAGARPALAGDLAGRLDLADLSPDPADGSAEDPAADPAIPVEALSAADVDLRLALDELALGTVAISDLHGAIRVVDRRLDIAVDEARLFDGALVAELGLDGRVDPAAASVAATASRLDMGAILTALELSDAVSGRSDAALTLEAQGRTLGAMIASAGGRATLNMGPGEIDSALAGLVGRSALTALLPIGNSDTTALHCAIGHFDVADGVATSTALLVDTEKATIAGEGAIDFGGNRLDLIFNPRSKDPNLLALVAPVRVHGPLDAPEVTVMTGDLVLETAAGLLLGVINPVAIVIPFVTAGTGDDNPCLAALNDRLEADDGTVPERLVEGAAGVVGGVAEGVGEAAAGVGGVLGDVGEGIGDALDGLFGGNE